MTPPIPERPGQRTTHAFWRMVRTLAVTYAVWLATLYFLQRSLMFPRSRVQGPVPPQSGAVEIWRLPRPDGVTAQAWFLPAKSRHPAPALVLLHGNAMRASDWEEWAAQLTGQGYHVLIPEFRGYAGTEGKPTRATLVNDVQAMLVRLQADARVERRAITFYGRSIGGAIAAEAVAGAAERPAALILHTAPARVADFSWHYGAPSWLVRDRFDAEAAVRRLRGGSVAVTVMGHRQDEIIPFSHAERLAQAAGVVCVTFDGTHNEFATEGDEARFEEVFLGALAKVK